MLSINIVRQYSTSGVNTAVNLSTGYLSTVGTAYYLPLTIDNFSTPTISILNVDGSATGNTLVADNPGDFDTLRVGDIVTSTSVGAFNTPASFTRDCYTATGLKYIVYDDT